MKNFKVKWLLLSFILSIASINTAWATRLFKTGQKIFFQDAALSSTMSGKRWKSDGGNVYAYFFNQKDHVGDDVTNWAEAGRLVYGTDGAAGAIYEFTVPSLPSGGDGVWWGVIFTRGNAASWNGKWNQTTDQYPADEKSLFTISDSKTSDNWNGSWSVMPEMLCSDITDPEWSKEDGLFFTDYSGEKGIVKITCTASQSFQFIVFDGTYYKSHADETNSTWTNYGPNTDGGYNFQFTADEAGEYVFQWDKTNHKLWVWAPKARLAKQTYLYFDASNSDANRWRAAAFGARYFYKYYDSGNDLTSGGTVDCTAPITGTWVYYTLVPNDDYAGQVMIERKNPTNMNGDRWNYTSTCSANTRDNKSQNCMFITSGEHDWWDAQNLDWKTYCPPKQTSTISDNSPVKYIVDGNEAGSESHPFLVEKGTTIRVTAGSSNYITDGNMTTTYRFYDDDSALGDGTQTETSYSYTASSTANTVHKMKVNALNEYNGATSSDKFSSILYYKAVNCYTVTYYGNGNNSGNVPAGSGSKYAQGANVTVATNSNSLGRSGYSFAGWNSAEHINGTDKATSSTISSIAADWRLYAKWTQSVTLDDNGGKGDGTGSVTMTYNCSTVPSITNPTRDGYTFAGWYAATDGNTLVINTSGVLQSGVSSYSTSAYWTWSGSAPTLYAHWTANEYTISLDDRSATTAVSPSSVTATYDANTLSASITNPSKTGYTFAGWYLDDDTNTGCGTHQLINTSGELNASVSDYTDASRNWIKADGETVYARWKANASVSAFNFQHGSGTYYSSSWTVVNFGGATDNMHTADFTMPSPTDRKFYVGWGGDFVGSGLGSGGSWSSEVDLSSLRLDPGTAAIGTATGATGKLVIYENSDEANLYVGFLPSGYGVTYNGSTKAFHATATTNLYETDVITISAADLTANAFKVQLATSSGYTDCALSTSETATTVNARAETMTSGVKGRFYIWINNSTSNFALYFKTCNNYLETAGNWSNASNWSLKNQPTIDDAVYIQKAVNVDIANAKAKSVLIDQYDSNTGKLTVASTGALVVATTIQKKDGDGNIVATEETDIILESDASGTGALVAGSASTTTKATVQFYSKAKYADSKYINQYFGIPADSVSKLNYYGSYLQKYDQPTDSWISFTEESKMGPWTAYRILREETSEGTYEVSGTLLLPGTGDGKTKTLTLNTSSHANDNMFANSWAAPIDITKLDTENDFVGATATIYIFNAGSAADYALNGEYTANKEARAGQWIELPVSATMAVPGDFDLNVIPSQQAFLVQATSGSGEHSLKLDYEKLVYNPIKANGATITPTRAPRHEQANDLEIVRLFMTGESGLGDRVLMYVRDDFSADEMDNGWEAYKLPGSEFAPQLCAYSGLGEMSISATNVIEGTVLGFYAGTEDSEYTFTFGYEGDNVWYLNDLEAQQSTLINAASSYNFSAVPGTVAERRFVISHTPIANTPTGIDNSEAVEGTQARKQMINGILYIIRGGQIYSTDGQIVK